MNKIQKKSLLRQKFCLVQYPGDTVSQGVAHSCINHHLCQIDLRMFAHGHTPFNYQFAYSLEDLEMLTECQTAYIRVGRWTPKCSVFHPDPSCYYNIRICITIASIRQKHFSRCWRLGGGCIRNLTISDLVLDIAQDPAHDRSKLFCNLWCLIRYNKCDKLTNNQTANSKPV